LAVEKGKQVVEQFLAAIMKCHANQTELHRKAFKDNEVVAWKPSQVKNLPKDLFVNEKLIETPRKPLS